MPPALFIGSSSESLSVAYAAQVNLDKDAEVTVWTQGIFELSRSVMESLIDRLQRSDFALFVFSPDDITRIRGQEFLTARDNVVFELGLFVGRLGQDRTFVVLPSGVEGFHLPSDLAGLTYATYNPSRTDGNLEAAMGPACNHVRTAIRKADSKM